MQILCAEKVRIPSGGEAVRIEIARHHVDIQHLQATQIGKPQILCLGALLFPVCHGIRGGFEGSHRKYVNQEALHGAVA